MASARSTGLAFAVLGHPDSETILEAPETPEQMRQLKNAAEAAGKGFFCSSAVGGCGGQLMTVNGRQRRPHFRHYSKTGCTLRDDADTRDKFTHRMIQNGLVAWLDQLGFPAKAEHYLDRHSRVDVYSTGAAIEVQLSGESEHSMTARTARYGQVTWLFGASTSIASRDALLDDQGAVLLVRLAGPQTGALQQLGKRPVEIGVRQVPTIEKTPVADCWFPLRDCSFDPTTGVQAPALSQALHSVAEARAAAEAARRREQEAEAERREQEAEAARRSRAGASGVSWSRWTAPLPTTPVGPCPVTPSRLSHVHQEKFDEVRARSASRSGVRPTVLSPDDLVGWEGHYGVVSIQLRQVLRVHGIQYSGSYPEWVADIDCAWVDGLPEHLIDPAMAALHRTTVVVSGPLQSIADPGVDPDGLVLERLIQQAFIVVSEEGGWQRYRATPSPPQMINVHGSET